MRMSVALAFGALSGFAAGASAQEASEATICLCEVSLDAGGPVASLDDVGGRVLMSGPEGYAPVASGIELAIGDRLVLMNGGGATLDAGAGCSVRLGSPSLVSVVARRGTACIAEDTLEFTVEPAQAPVAAARQLPPGQTGLARLSEAGFFTDLGAHLEAKGVGDTVPARNLDETLPVSP